MEKLYKAEVQEYLPEAMAWLCMLLGGTVVLALLVIMVTGLPY